MHFKKAKTLKSLKKNLQKTLPEKVSQVLESYETFSERPIPEDAKGFSAHHSACKSAVTHAETLLKLAKWTEGETSIFEVRGEFPRITSENCPAGIMKVKYQIDLSCCQDYLANEDSLLGAMG